MKQGKSGSSSSDEEAELRRGPWTLEEDTLLIRYVSCHGEGRWNLLAKRSGLKRTGKSCRLRWLNYLKPDVKRGNLTAQEQLVILQLHSKWGNRWSKIAQHLPGRTDNEIKNYWRTRVQKQARQMKIDSNSKAFQEVIQCFWIPRLLQKLQGSSPPSVISSENSATIHPQLMIDHSSLIPQFSQENGHTSEMSKNTSFTSSEFSSSSQIPQVSECPPIPLEAMGNNVENISYGMESFRFEDPIGSCHASENNWVGHNNLGDNLWNIDESWQYRHFTTMEEHLGSLFMG